MNVTDSRARPLRRVVGMAHPARGLVVELLECGHQQPPPTNSKPADMYPDGKYRQKRRCTDCGLRVELEEEDKA